MDGNYLLVTATSDIPPDRCRVTAFVADGDGNPVADSAFEFTFWVNTASVNRRLTLGITLAAATNAHGVLADADGNPYFELKRPDHTDFAGSYWTVTNADLPLDGLPFDANAETVELNSLVAP
jgi:hypothetical protein